MKCLTVRQPWATLLADPDLPKWIETRPRRTSVRGRIGIIAGKHVPPSFIANTWNDCPPPEPFASLNEHHMTHLDRWFDPIEDSQNDYRWLYDFRRSTFPFGALIGTVDLYDCVPIDGDGDETAAHDWPAAVMPDGGPVAEVSADGLVYWRHGDGECPDADWSDQLPFGDFTPGRWAWLTRNARLLPEPIPMSGALHWQDVDDPA